MLLICAELSFRGKVVQVVVEVVHDEEIEVAVSS